jgi:hypothetical protein
MAISATALNGAIMDALADYNNGAYQNQKESPRHLKIMGDTMKDYFEENIVITYAWAAALPPPASTSDPAVSFTSEAVFPSFDLTPSANLDVMALLIQSAFAGAAIKHASGFAIPPGSFLAASPPALGRTASADGAILSCVCVPVCAWVLTLINSASLAGTHGSYAGATEGMAIA